MKRININIDDEIGYRRALWNCLQAFIRLGVKGGAVSFHDLQKVNLEINDNDNLTFTVMEGDSDE